MKELVRHQHIREKHGGPVHVLCQIRQKYWILGGLTEVKSLIHRCPLCQMRRKKAMCQQMAPLPEERVRRTKPFEITGVDVMGPWFCRHKGSKALHKCWVLVFTCFSSRAVHAECMPSMDASTAINAIVRFAARRPGVRKFWSDNGSNFTKANKTLIEEVEGFKERIG